MSFVRYDHLARPLVLILLALAAAPARAESDDAASDSSEIVVDGRRQPFRGDVPIEDLPQAYHQIDGATLRQVGITRIQDALDLAPGIVRTNNYGGSFDAFAVRGFVGDPNAPSHFLINGYNARGFGGVGDAVRVDRIEILKGPASALFGRGEPGGTVNVITRKPQFEEAGSIALGGGSFNAVRAEADYTGPISDNIAFRFIGSFESSDTFRDFNDTDKYSFSPSLLARFGDTTITYDLDFAHQKFVFDRGVVAVNNRLGVIPRSRFLGEPGDGRHKATITNHQLELQHSFGESWHLILGGALHKTSLFGFHEQPELAVDRQRLFVDGRTLARQRRFQDYTTRDLTLRAEISGRVQTGPLTHHLVFGADVERFKTARFTLRSRPALLSSNPSFRDSHAIDIFNPVYGNLPVPGEIIFNDVERQKSYGIYINDQIDIGSLLTVKLGLRYDNFDQLFTPRRPGPLTTQKVDSFSPQAAVLFTPSKALSIFGGYSKGFRPNTGRDFFNVAFRPEITKAYEIGMKVSALDDKLKATLALFSMRKSGIITQDPVRLGFSIAAGSAKSEGVELDISGELPGNFSFSLGYAYIDARSTTNLPGIIGAGQPLLNIARHSGNLLLTKQVDLAGRPLTFGTQINHVGRRLGETNTRFFLPSHTIARVFADLAVSDRFTLSGQISNLFDKTYYLASFARLWVYPAPPRQFLVRGSLKF